MILFNKDNFQLSDCIKSNYIILGINTFLTMLIIFITSLCISVRYYFVPQWTRTLCGTTLIGVFLAIGIPMLYETIVKKFNYKIL